MGKHVFLTVFGISILAVVLGVYVSSLKKQEISVTGYPWQIENLPSGNTRVFGITIGLTTVAEAEQLFKEKAAINLFAPSPSAAVQSTAVIEAYFDMVKVSGLKSKMVMSLDLSDETIQKIYNRGARISTLESGTRKVTLLDEDVILLQESVIVGITYLPSIHLDAQLIENRFGKPAERLEDAQSDAIHWLYPAKGVDIVLSESEKEVIQYVKPGDFDKLLKPLKSL
ncbi:MAG: hypothetical protein OQK46_11115 [Gammaproteobacteria bacterium]|nr:hypothetical protein [Gammaproteobacteria bacterium]